MFVCLSVVLRNAREYSPHMETVNIASKELQNFGHGDPEYKKGEGASSPQAWCKGRLDLVVGVKLIKPPPPLFKGRKCRIMTYIL